jgi:hypothetical protein
VAISLEASDGLNLWSWSLPSPLSPMRQESHSRNGRSRLARKNEHYRDRDETPGAQRLLVWMNLRSRRIRR